MFIQGMKEYTEPGCYAPLGVMAVTLRAEAPDSSMGALACKFLSEMVDSLNAEAVSESKAYQEDEGNAYKAFNK